MKCVVTSAYTDKSNGLVHLAGETVELTEARASELASAGFVEKPAKAPAKKPAAKRTAAKKAE